jgi:hypothetical protein
MTFSIIINKPDSQLKDIKLSCSVVTLTTIMLNVANNPCMLSVIMLNVVMLSVVAPI